MNIFGLDSIPKAKKIQKISPMLDWDYILFRVLSLCTMANMVWKIYQKVSNSGLHFRPLSKILAQ